MNISSIHGYLQQHCKREEEEEEDSKEKITEFLSLPGEKMEGDEQNPNNKTSPNGPSITAQHLYALTAASILVATGTVPTQDIAFCFFTFLYSTLLSHLAFPPTNPRRQPPVFGHQNRALAVYVSAGAVVGLLLPAAYMLEGIARGDKEGLRTAAPHVFLLSAQVFMECISFSREFPLPVRAFVPVSYNSRRLFAISDWLHAEFEGSEGRPAWRVYAGRGLAVANMGFWFFNLFGFLLPVYLPRAFKKYYAAAVQP